MVIAGSAAAQGNFGLGIIVGEPTGCPANSGCPRERQFDGAAAWSFSDEAALHLHADYLFHDFGLIDVEKGKLPVYFGIGAPGEIRE